MGTDGHGTGCPTLIQLRIGHGPPDVTVPVQVLLRLDRIDKVRQSLQTIVNSCNTDAKRIGQALQQAQANLVRALGIPVLSKNGNAEAVNQRRVLLQLEPLTDLGPDTSLKTGMGTPSDSPAAKSKIPKKQAQTDICLHGRVVIVYAW